MDGESNEERERRLRSLWLQLDVKRKGYLDVPALKSGLAQMNHRKQPAGRPCLAPASSAVH